MVSKLDVANLYERVQFSLGAPFIWLCAISKQKAYVITTYMYVGIYIFLTEVFISYLLTMFLYMCLHMYLRGSLNKFPDFFIMALLLIVYTPVPFEVISFGCNALVLFQHLLEGPWKSSRVSVSMTFVTASFISSIVS